MTLTRLRPLAALLLVAMLTTSACKSGTDVTAEDTDTEVEAVADAPEASDVSPDAGEVADGTYSNEFFGFSMTFPQEWAVASQETQDELQNVGSDIVAGDDETMKSSLEAAEKNTYQLLMISEKPVGTPVTTFNPNVVVMAEKVSHAPGIKSGAEYLSTVSGLLQQTELPYEPAGEPYEVDINGQTFHRADFTLNAGGMAIKQSYLAKVDQGYALGFVLSGTEETMPQLDEIANSVTFE